jgi:aldehyde dehydrogenase (NAD+)
MGYIKSGKEDGATVHIGGERHGNEGYFIQPTIFTGCKPSMKIVQEEIFGPVAAVIKFTTEEGNIKYIPYEYIRVLTNYHRGC